MGPPAGGVSAARSGSRRSSRARTNPRTHPAGVASDGRRGGPSYPPASRHWIHPPSMNPIHSVQTAYRFVPTFLLAATLAAGAQAQVFQVPVGFDLKPKAYSAQPGFVQVDETDRFGITGDFGF